MLRNYLKIFFRNTAKQPVYSAINIFGLSIGLACSIVAFLYILNETAMNKEFDDADKIYRIGGGFHTESKTDSSAATLYEVAPALVEQIPEVQSATRFLRWFDRSLIKVNNEYYPRVQCLITDSLLLDVFSFKILQGDPETFLKSPTKVAITESLAKKIFKDQDPIGELIKLEGYDVEVGWVMQDPEKSIINFELLANFEFMPPLKSYLSRDVYTFFKTREPLHKTTERTIREVSNKILLDRYSQWASAAISPVQPLKDLYLRSNLRYEVGRTGSLRNLYIFGFLAGIILLIAIINYVNLLTSRSEYRNKEVGIRKVVGADKNRIRRQFLGESIILTIIALLISFVFAEFLVYLVNDKLNMDLSLLKQSSFIIFILFFLFSITIGILSGVYPSFIMAQYSPLKVIKGILSADGNSNLLKIVLVIIQFSISTFLIISIFIFNSQIRFLKSKELGFNEENLIVLREVTEKLNLNYDNIRNDLLAYHHIQNVSGAQSYPGIGRSGQAIRKKTDDPKKAIGIEENRVQDHYLETMQIELVKGRSFNPDFDDNQSIIINETAAKLLNVENPIGLEVYTNRESVVIGVMKDYHYSSIARKIGPLYLSNYADNFNNYVIRIDSEDRLGTVQYIQKIVMKYDPDYYWNYFFLEDMFSNMYRGEERLYSMIFFGSGIAIILSILGLFALTSYTVSRRFKEIGIRKTFGASVKNIVNKLNHDIIKWVLITNIVAWPVAYLVMTNWLQNYPYRVDINWAYFILASAISLFIAWLTISFQAIKAARMNPVDAIRYE